MAFTANVWLHSECLFGQFAPVTYIWLHDLLIRRRRRRRLAAPGTLCTYLFSPPNRYRPGRDLQMSSLR